ncbi:MAG: hypothetical protein J6A23_04400 [Thermoguttaceae bacterium]|nr:hypothetical protein [Thermoguttaceae bacterium]
MRLTLRTLLNWINENYSAEDAKRVAEKVEESELAKVLKTQIEEVMRIPGLPAPLVLDGTPLGNANSSAEYLDNAMPSEKTPEYEKFCLHSEVILGEAASCHRILSRVLSEAQEISPELRERLYGLYRYADTGDEYSIPIPATLPKQEPMPHFSEIPDSLLPARNTEGENAERSGSLPEKKVSEAALESTETPNYWKWATLTLLGLWGLWLAVGLAFPKTIPGRMLNAVWETPAAETVSEYSPSAQDEDGAGDAAVTADGDPAENAEAKKEK